MSCIDSVQFLTSMHAGWAGMVALASFDDEAWICSRFGSLNGAVLS